MTPDERTLITGLFDRLRQADSAAGNKDAEALQFIQQQTAAAPSAPYLLVQTLLVQEHALTNAQTRIADLERQVAAAGARQPRTGSGTRGRQLPGEHAEKGHRHGSAAPAPAGLGPGPGRDGSLRTAKSGPTGWRRLRSQPAAPRGALPDDQHNGARWGRQLPEICARHGRGGSRRGHVVPGHPEPHGA